MIAWYWLIPAFIAGAVAWFLIDFYWWLRHRAPEFFHWIFNERKGR